MESEREGKYIHLASGSDTLILDSSEFDPDLISGSAPSSGRPNTSSNDISADNFDHHLSSCHYKQVYHYCVNSLRRSFTFSDRAQTLLAAAQSLLKGCCSAKAYQEMERKEKKRILEPEMAFKLPLLALRVAQEYIAVLNFEYPDYGDLGIEKFLNPEEIQRVQTEERRQEDEGQSQWGQEEELILQENSVRRLLESERHASGLDVQEVGLSLEGEKASLEGEMLFVVAEEWFSEQRNYIQNEGIIKRFKPDKYIYTRDRRIYLKSGLLPYLHYRLLRPEEFLPLARLYGCPYAILRSPWEIHLPVISIYWPEDCHRKLQVSSLDTIADIKAVIESFLMKRTQCRVWVFSHFSLSPAYLSKLEQAQSLTYFPGTIAQDTDTVGHLRLGFNGNSLFVEYQRNSKYYLTDTLTDSRCANCLQKPEKAAFALDCPHCSKAKYCSPACLQTGRGLHSPFCERRSCWQRLLQPSPARETAAQCSGLKNYGAVCYGNAVLQGLASFTAVRQLAKMIVRQTGEGDEEKLRLARLFGQLIVRLRSASQAATTAKPLISTLKRSYSQFRSRELHDSHEFLTCLLAALHESLQKANPQALNLPEGLPVWRRHWTEFTSKQESPIAKALYGMLQTSVVCSCGNRESTYQEFSTLELPLSDYIPTEQVQIRYFPVNSAAILIHIGTQREIRVSDLVATLSDQNQAESVVLAYQRGTELVILSPETELMNYIAARAPLLAYARPKDAAGLYEVHLTVEGKEVALPRIGFMQEKMTLADLHRSVFHSFEVYYNKSEIFAPPKGDRTNGYDLYYQHIDPTVPCGLCGRLKEPGCPLPYTGAEAIGFLGQFGLKVRLDVRWHPQQQRVNLKRLDEEKQVRMGKVMNCVSLRSCLDTMLAGEKLDAENRWKCAKCCKQVEAYLHLSLIHAPNALILHIKRFNASGTTLRKLTDKVEFPVDLVLDLKPDQAQAPIPKTYSLCSVIIHQGATLESGHFCAVSRVGSRWMLLDDSKVVEISEEEMLRMEAYLLFYECVEGLES